MTIEKVDPVTGTKTTGHEWNGIEELTSPVPRVVIFFLFATALFAVIYWILMPAWPTGVSYTKGLLGNDQRQVLTRQLEEATSERAAWTNRIAAASFAEIRGDAGLMRRVRETGRTLFVDNCAACHGVRGTGGPGYPNLVASAWLWGGAPETIAQTIRHGINSAAAETRVSQMPAFGRDRILDRTQVLGVSAYVRSLSGQALNVEETRMASAGANLFAANCVSCHGEKGLGIRELGAPDLTDSTSLYGNDLQSVYLSVYSGRQGQMPSWSTRLTPLEIKTLAIYVGTLGDETR